MPSIRSCRSAARPRTASASSAPSIRAKGLKCSSAGTGPAQVAVAIKTAIAALEGKVVPQSVKLPLAIVEDPNFKEGQDYYPDQSRQLLRRQLLPDLRHQLHRAGNHGPDRSEPVIRVEAAPRERFSVVVAIVHPRRRWMRLPLRFSAWKAISKRYGGVRALERGRPRRSRPAASTRCSARTAPASRR